MRIQDRNLPVEIILLTSIVGLVVIGLVIISIGYIHYELWWVDVRLALLGLGVLANVALATAYVFSLLRSRQDEIRAQEKPLIRDVLNEVINPALSDIDHNLDGLYTIYMNHQIHGPFTFYQVFLDNYVSEPYILTSKISLKSSSCGIFVDMYPDAKKHIENHDRNIYVLLEKERELVTKLSPKLNEYIDTTKINTDSTIDVNYISVLMIRMVRPRLESDFFELDEEYPILGEKLPDCLSGHHEELIDIYTETIPWEDYKEYGEKRRIYYSSANNLRKILNEYKNNLRYDYSIDKVS